MRVKVQTKKGHRVVDINRRKAIRLKCIECAESYKDIEFCEFKSCDLYPFRMGTGKQDAKKRKRAIRNYCLDCCAGDQHEVYKCPSKDCPLFAFRKSSLDNSVKISSA